MKTTRRTFMGILGAATLAAKDAFGFFRKKGRVTESPSVIGPPPQGEPHKSVCYVYNAGMDFEGIQGHTFGKYTTIPGGKVTRIEQCEEWLDLKPRDFATQRGEASNYWFPSEWDASGRPVYSRVGRFGRMMGIRPRRVGYEPSKRELAHVAGLYRIERVVQELRPVHPVLGKRVPFGAAERYFPEGGMMPRVEHLAEGTEYEPVYESRLVIVHPAKEIADNLATWSHYQIVRLPFWDGKQVDLDGVNALVEGDAVEKRLSGHPGNLTKRMSAAKALASRNEAWARPLSKAMQETLVRTEQDLAQKRRLETEAHIETVFSSKLKALLA